jgi:excisionase family DNA binding protein
MNLLDYEQTAEEMGCTPRLVRKLAESRQIDSVKVGRLVRIEPDAITRYIEAHRRKAVS